MKIQEEIIKNVNTSWRKDLIIRYLYVSLAPFFKRDVNFFFVSDETKEQIMNSNVPINKENEMYLVYCKTISEYYHNLLDTFNIYSKIIKTNNRRIPHYALVVYSDKCHYYIDPLKDLMNSQVGLRTTFYGVIPKSTSKIITNDFPKLTFLPIEYLKEMDEYLGFLINGLYMNNFYEILHQKLTTNKVTNNLNQFLEIPLNPKDWKKILIEKIIFMSNYLINMPQVPGIIERAQYYAYIIGQIFNHGERKNIEIRYSLDRTIIIEIELQDKKEIFKEQITKDGKFTLKRNK
jgi:hypothetical protein